MKLILKWGKFFSQSEEGEILPETTNSTKHNVSELFNQSEKGKILPENTNSTDDNCL